MEYFPREYVEVDLLRNDDVDVEMTMKIDRKLALKYNDLCLLMKLNSSERSKLYSNQTTDDEIR